jgi:hypothetical protein
MRTSCATGLLAACLVLVAAGLAIAREATEDGKGSEKKKTDILDVRVPIPSYSKDVSDNGCKLRASPNESFTEADADIRHVRFEDLISDVVGRYAVRAIVDPPAVFLASLDGLDPEMRTLVLLDVLHDSLGRDGLHTFFFMKGGVFAPNILEALKTADMVREHALFADAMALFGPQYPVEEEARARYFSYSSLDTPLNDFDKRMLKIAEAFGSREAFGKAMTAYVERTPTLWTRIESERARLGEIARLRYLNQALMARTRNWDTSDSGFVAQLAAMPKEQRWLLVMHIFNAEFENGGVHQFFLNSSGVVAPEVYEAFLELGLERQAAIFKRGLDMLGAKYQRDTVKRRARFFDHADWTDWDKQLAGLTDELYALDGGPTVVRLNAGAAIEGGPGIWPAMAVYARNKNLLPC